MRLEVRSVDNPRELLGWLPAVSGTQVGMRRAFLLQPAMNYGDTVPAACALIELPVCSLKDSSSAHGADHWIAYGSDVPRETLKRIDGFVPAEGFDYE